MKTKLLLHTQKTGVQVNAVLPDFVASLLEATPTVTGKYFFWSGTGNLDVIVGSWQRRLRKLFRLAGVTDGHAHRFRDTFAISLLIAGIPMERVSILLGIKASELPKNTTRPGRSLGSARRKRTCSVRGSKIRS